MASDDYITMPLLRLRHRLDQGVSGPEKTSHVAGEEKSIRDATKNAKRRLKVEHVAHDRNFAALREEMIVVETPEGAAHHGIAEMKRPFERRDATGEMLPDAEMTGPPGDLLPERHQTARHTGNRALAGVSSRVHVQINTARQIKRALNGRANLGRKLDYRHNGARVRFRV